MPEGHTVHRIARQLTADLGGHRVSVTSPQGRFAAGAALLDQQVLLRAEAVGKQMFVHFDSGAVLRVHLGIYGAWDLAGTLTTFDGFGPVASLGAPRVHRRIGEADATELLTGDFPPAPVGAVRLRLATETTVADLRGPTACEVLDPDAAAAVVRRLGPDPATSTDLRADGDRVVAAVTARATPVGQLLMDQSVVAGIGNIYRAELLFRARLDPWRPGRSVAPDLVRGLWEDWAVLLADGIRVGAMITRDDLTPEQRAAAITDKSIRYWVYHRTGLGCLVCGTPVVMEPMATRKLYRCPSCQG